MLNAKTAEIQNRASNHFFKSTHDFPGSMKPDGLFVCFSSLFEYYCSFYMNEQHPVERHFWHEGMHYKQNTYFKSSVEFSVKHAFSVTA